MASTRDRDAKDHCLTNDDRYRQEGRDIWQERLAHTFQCTAVKRDGNRCLNRVDAEGAPCWAHAAAVAQGFDAMKFGLRGRNNATDEPLPGVGRAGPRQRRDLCGVCVLERATYSSRWEVGVIQRQYEPADGRRALTLLGAYIHIDDSQLHSEGVGAVLPQLSTDDDMMWLVVSLARLGGVAIVRAAQAEGIDPATVLQEFRTSSQADE